MAYQNQHYGNRSQYYGNRSTYGGNRGNSNGNYNGNWKNKNSAPQQQRETIPVEDAMRYLSPYFSKEDHRMLAKSLNTKTGVSWDKQAVLDAAGMAEHLRSRGLDFKVAENRFSDQIDVKLSDSNLTVRLFDNSNPGLIGRVSDGKRYYHYTKRTGGIPEVSMPFKKAVLDLVLGNVPGSVYRNKTPSVSNTGRREYNYWIPLNSAYPDVVLSVNTNGRQERPFVDATSARKYIDDSITSAKKMFAEGIDIDGIIDAIDRGEEPTWSRKDNFADMQYGLHETLLRVKEAQMEGLYDEQGFLAVDAQNPDDVFYDYGLKNPVYAQDWKQYAKFLVDGFVDSNLGSYEDGFNPVIVSEYMDSGYSSFRNNQDLISAIKMAGGGLDNIYGTDFYLSRLSDQLIKFDPSTAVTVDQMSNPIGRAAMEAACDTLKGSNVAFDRNDILMDANGIISWKGKRSIRDRKGGPGSELEPEELSGTIGQVFLPDERGVVRTRFAGSSNYLFVPGYEAYITSGPEPMMDRLRVKGYQDVVCQAVRRAVKSDVMSEGPTFDNVTVLNNTYSHLYERRFDLDYFENSTLSEKEMNAVLSTLSRRVRFPSEYEGSTVSAHMDAERGIDRNKNGPSDAFSYYKMTGGKDLSLLENDSFGYFDKWATGTAKTQGLVRYLTSDAQVVDGKIVPGKSEHCPLLELDVFDKKEFNAWDRCQMSFGQMLTAKRVAKGVNACYCDMGGWNYDDAYVVSEDFAIANSVPDTSGNTRPLGRGDKLSDFNGNKGVISYVVPSWAKHLYEMSPEEQAEKMQWAKENKVEDLVMMYASNPTLDVIGSPYSALSRANGGLIRELQENPQTLHDPFHNRTVEGGMGQINMIVTDMTADEKTHHYSNPGEGRKFSSQLAWACASKGATEILDEVYSGNSAAFEDFREYLVCVGLDVSPTGQLQSCYTPQEGEERHVFEPTVVRKKDENGNPLAWADRKATEQGFLDEIAHRGGMLRMPFPLKFPDGTILPEAKDGRGGYLLPVLSSDLRSERQIVDGRLRTHDATNHYGKIYMSMMDYMESKSKLSSVEETLSRGGLAKEDWMKLTRQQKTLQETMAKAEDQAQSGFDAITKQVIDFQIEGENGKHSFIRDKIMSRKMPNTATMVATSDPRLRIDQIGLSGKSMAKLGVSEGERVLTWRDPVLKDGAMRYLEVVRDDSLVGYSVSPFTGKSKGRDYDGDAEGIMKLRTKAAKEAAKRCFSMEANVLEEASGAKGSQKLYFNDGMDYAAAAAATKGTLTKDGKPSINDLGLYRQWIEKSANMGVQMDYVGHLNQYVQKAHRAAHCTDILKCGSMEDTVYSLEDMVVKGCKGSDGKFKRLMDYLGVEYNGKCGSVCNVRDMGHTLSTDEDRIENQLANAIKVQYTGSAGAFSQRGMAALWDVCAKDVLDNTEKVTQAVLDVKHDPDQGRVIVQALDDLRNAWSGQVTYRNGTTRQMSVSEFCQNLTDLMEGRLGLKVNPQQLSNIAEAMRQPDGTVCGIQNMRRSALCDVAYGGGYESLCESAKDGRMLFEEGTLTGRFAPKIVREGNPFQNIAKADTLSNEKLAEADRLMRSDATPSSSLAPSERYGSKYTQRVDSVPNPVPTPPVTPMPAPAPNSGVAPVPVPNGVPNTAGIVPGQAANGSYVPPANSIPAPPASVPKPDWLDTNGTETDDKSRDDRGGDNFSDGRFG